MNECKCDLGGDNGSCQHVVFRRWAWLTRNVSRLPAVQSLADDRDGRYESHHSVSLPRSCSAYDESCYPCLKRNTCGKQWYLTLRQVKTRCGILPCKLWLMNCNVVLVFRSVALLPRRRFISGPLMAFRCLNAAFIPPWSPQPVTKTAA